MRSIISFIPIILISMILLAGCDLLGDDGGSSGSADGSADGSDNQLVVGYHDGYRDLPDHEMGIYATTSEGTDLQDSLEKALIEKIAAEENYSVNYVLVETRSLADTDLGIDNVEFFEPLAEALNNGRVQVMIGNFSPYESRQDQVLFLTTYLTGTDGEERAFAVALNDDSLHTRLDATMQKFIDDGTVDDLLEQYGVDSNSE